MEVGKKYKGKGTGRIYTCVGIDTRGNHILEDKSGDFFSAVSYSNYEEYVEPRSGVVTVYVVMSTRTKKVWATAATDGYPSYIVVVGQADINWVEKVN